MAPAVYTPIETRQLNDADPPAWFAHVLAKPRRKRHNEWPPWNWTSRQRAIASGFCHGGGDRPKLPAAPAGWID
jgi:hypothetical protein